MLKQAWTFLLMFLFIRDLGGVRTPNPQSRNLIFYPVELRGRFANYKIVIRRYFYANNFLTIVEMVFPSA